MTTHLYTNSRLRVLRQCLRLHLYRYEMGILQPENADTLFGTVGHQALEAYLRAWQARDTETGLCSRAATEVTDDDGAPADPRLPAALAVVAASALPASEQLKLRLLIIAYHERWGGEDWEILAIEQEFRYQIGEYLIGGKIDAIIRNRADGRVYVLEHKFTGIETSLGGTYWERLALDSQISIYLDGAAMLGHQPAGCIYDVIKRPQHEPLAATPIEAREYTKGRGCKRCGGSAKPGAIAQGRGTYEVVFASEVKNVPCDECAGTGWKCDPDGKPQAPRLHANQRAEDEPLDKFEERLLDVIAEAPDNWLQRSVVVRLDDELPAMRVDLVDTIAIAERARELEAWPRNPDNCAKFGRMCWAFELCAGRASIDDTQRFPRGVAHPELAETT